MRVLVTETNRELADRIAEDLAVAHHVDRVNVNADSAHLPTGAGALIHFGLEPDVQDASDLIDLATRRTYHLLLAAATAGVERCLFISTLQLLQDYEEKLAVTESWRSLAPSSDPALLASHLGEIVAKEVARDRRLKVATIRLGFPVVTGSRSSLRAAHGTASIAVTDAVDAIRRALAAEIDWWQDIHVQSPVPGARFPMHRARSLLGFPDSPAPGGAR